MAVFWMMKQEAHDSISLCLTKDMCVFDILAMDDLEAGDVHGAF